MNISTSSREPQPSEAQEAANAAYLWRRHVQSLLLHAMNDADITLDKAQWWFERFTTAYQREIAANDREAAERLVQ